MGSDMPNNDEILPIQFELPANSLTMGDLVGRAARFVRVNYRLVFELFLIPMIVYILCWELLLWLADHLWAPLGGNTEFALDIRLAIVLFCFLAIWFCIWWLRVKVLALWLLMTGFETSVIAANKRARDLRMFWIFLPTVFIELTEAAWSTLLMIFISQSDSKSLSAALQITGLYFGMLILWILPFRMFATFNLYPAYNALVSEQSLGKGFGKFWFYCTRAPLTLFFATLALVLVIDSLELPIMLPSAVGGALQLSHAFNKDVIEWVELIPRLVMEIVIGVVSSGICSAFAVLLDNDLKIKLEGRDVTSTLEQFIAKA